MSRALLAVLAAYLCGSIPFGLLLVRMLRGTDLRGVGSGNIGATNALRAGGTAIGVATLILDLLKGTAGYLGGRAMLGDGPAWTLGLLVAAPVVGHMFPVWLLFRGGKGVATGLGTLLAADPWLVPAPAAVFLALALPTRRVSVGSVAAALAAPAAAFVRHGASPLSWGVLAVGLLVVVRHRENIGRLLAGREPPIGGPPVVGRDR